MSKEAPLFPAEESIHVVVLALQSAAAGGIVETAHSMGASTSRDSAIISAMDSWRKFYPDYLAGSTAEIVIRRAKLTKRVLFWTGFVVGLVSFPLALVIAGIIMRFA